jgi:hypothetical protein
MRYLCLVCVLFCATLTTLAQTTEKTFVGCEEYGGTRRTILKSPGRRFKIKAVVGASSATAREADYVEFKTMEKIYSIDKPAIVLFEKETPIFGFVTHRKKRRVPFKRGQIELRLEPLVNWNGEEIQMAILRHGPFKTADKAERRNDPCKRTDRPDHNCIAGRGNAPVAPIITSVAGVAVGTVAAIAKEEETRFIAATSFFSLAKELGNVVSGTDVEVAKDEIFDLIIETPTVCALPVPPKKEKE